MRNYFTFAGTDCRDFKLYINGHKTFNSPERDYSLYSVPGRSGSIAEDKKSFKNLELTYSNSFIFEDFEQNFSDLKNFLLSQSGYQRLVDTYHPDEYRLALFRKAITPSMNESNEVGTFDLVFECQPQRYLLSGETVRTFTANGTITNPTLFESQPLLRVYGTGTFSIGSHMVVISAADSYTDIDCRVMDCFKGSVNKNSYVTMSNYEFPTLAPGDNGVTLGSGITQIDITPRWFRV